MKFKILRLLSVVAGLLCAPFVSANIVTFDDDVRPYVYSPIVSGGLVFQGDSTWTWYGPQNAAHNGTVNLISGFGHSLTITKEGGGAFSIDQFDAGLGEYTQYEWFGIWLNSDLIVLGRDFMRFTNGINFASLTDVTSITIGIPPEDGYFALDNIVWHPTDVPESSGLALVLLGFGLLLVRRFKA